MQIFPKAVPESMFRLTDICWKRESFHSMWGWFSYVLWRVQKKTKVPALPPSPTGGLHGGTGKIEGKVWGVGMCPTSSICWGQTLSSNKLPTGDKGQPIYRAFFIMPSLLPFPTNHRKAMGSFVGGVLPCSTSLLTRELGRGTWDNPYKRLSHLSY